MLLPLSFTMPSIIQIAFVLESILNIPGIIALTLYPFETLSLFTVSPTLAPTITPTGALFTRITGLFIAGITPQLLLAAPNTVSRVEKRKLVYITLGAGEVFLIPLFIWEAYRASDLEKLAQGGGLSKSASLMFAGNLLSLLLWRVWVWAIRPEWFDGAEGKESEGDLLEGKTK